MSDIEPFDVLVHDVWDALPEERVVIGEGAYRDPESLAARLLHLAVDSCRRRASTLGELYRALRFRRDLPLMDPDRPLVAAELSRYARPDLLIEQGRPRFLEFNNSSRLGGATVTPRLAEAYAGLCPQSGLRPPPAALRGDRAFRGAGPDAPRQDRAWQRRPSSHARHRPRPLDEHHG